MGCLESTMLLIQPKSTGQTCLRELEKVDVLLEEMVNKYDRQRVKLDNQIKEGLRRKEDRQILLQKMKQKK